MQMFIWLFALIIFITIGFIVCFYGGMTSLKETNVHYRIWNLFVVNELAFFSCGYLRARMMSRSKLDVDILFLCSVVDDLAASQLPKTPPGGNRLSRMTGSACLEDRIPNYMNNLKSMFALAYIWGFGGNLHDR